MTLKWFQLKNKKKTKTLGSYQQLYALDSRDFQWHQRQWKHCDVPNKKRPSLRMKHNFQKQQ